MSININVQKAKELAKNFVSPYDNVKRNLGHICVALYKDHPKVYGCDGRILAKFNVDDDPKTVVPENSEFPVKGCEGFDAEYEPVGSEFKLNPDSYRIELEKYNKGLAEFVGEKKSLSDIYYEEIDCPHCGKTIFMYDGFPYTENQLLGKIEPRKPYEYSFPVWLRGADWNPAKCVDMKYLTRIVDVFAELGEEPVFFMSRSRDCKDMYSVVAHSEDMKVSIRLMVMKPTAMMNRDRDEAEWDESVEVVDLEREPPKGDD